VGEGGGHEDRVGAAEAVGRDHRPGLVGQAAVGVEDGLRRARGARGEQHACQVRGAGGRLARRAWGAAVGEAGDGGPLGDHDGRVDLGEGGVHVGRPGEVVDGRGDRAQAPAGPVEEERLVPVGQLPRHHVAPADTGAAAQPPGHRGHAPLDLPRVEAKRPGGDTGPAGQHVVERRDVPRATGPPVVGRPGVRVRRAQAPRHPVVSGLRHAPPAGVRPRSRFVPT
jgi:hypothetical protein